MIVLFTDFGADGPYVGQMKARLHMDAPGVPVVDLMHDLAPFDARAAAYLLAAYAGAFPPGAVFVSVVDPGVGGERGAVAIEAAGRWYVGPENGLFEIVMRRALDDGQSVRAFDIVWRPDDLSASFHGRDLFAPVAARIAAGVRPGEDAAFAALPLDGVRRSDWPDDLAAVVYLDRYGNAVTGLRAVSVAAGAGMRVGDRDVPRVRTFGDAPPGTAFWYENANGLVEVAVNQGHAGRVLGLHPGSQVSVTQV